MHKRKGASFTPFLTVLHLLHGEPKALLLVRSLIFGRGCSWRSRVSDCDFEVSAPDLCSGAHGTSVPGV